MNQVRLKSQVAAAVVALLTALGTGSAAGQVTYSGDVLNVDGRVYERNPYTFRHKPGEVIAIAKDGRADELAMEIKRLGLSAARSGQSFIMFLVSVPSGFELQWADALRDIPAVEAASDNRVELPAT